MLKTTTYGHSCRPLYLFIMIVSVITTMMVPIQNVLAQGTYYVGGAGANDNNPGTSTQPFLSIKKAGEMASAGSVVIIRAGTYRETIIPANNGITFQPDQGAVVTVSGLDEAGDTGWSVHDGSIYKKIISLPVNGYQEAVEDGTTIAANQVFKDTAMMIEARWPKINSASEMLVRSKLRKRQRTSFFNHSTITDDSLVHFGSLVGGKVWMNGWYMSATRTILTHNGATITYAPHEDTDIPNKFKKFYYVTGKLGLLTQEKEWHYQNGTLYFWQEGGGSPVGVQYKKRNWGFDLRNKTGITIKGIQFYGCDPVMGNEQTSGITIDGIKAKYLNHTVMNEGADVIYKNALKTGIRLLGSGNTVKNSEFQFTASQCIWIGQNGIIHNNLFKDINYEGNYGAAITPWGNTGSIQITYNTMRRLGRSGIDFYGSETDFSNNRHLNMTISFNDISNFGALSIDVGAIYAARFMDLTGTRIHHNWIHDSWAYDTPGGVQPDEDLGLHCGMYLDQASGPVTFDHNVLWGNVQADYYVLTNYTDDNSGFHRIVLPSLIANNSFNTPPYPGGAGAYGSYITYESPFHDDIKNNIFQSNVTIGTPNDTADCLISSQAPNYINSGVGGLIYRLSASSSLAINKGRELPNGITDGSIGVPDIGAYEFDGSDWVPGYTAQGGGGGGTTQTIRIEAESHNDMFGVALAAPGIVGSTDGGDWMRYDNINLGAGYSTFSARYANGGGTGNAAVIRLGSITGTIIGTLSTPSTGGWGTFTTANTSLTGASGVQNVFVVFPSGTGNGNFDWFEFSGATDTTPPSAPVLTSPAKTSTSVSLSWTVSTDNIAVTGYDIYIGSTLLTTITPATTYNVTGLSPNTAYAFTVKAKDAANNLSAASNTANVTTNPTSTTLHIEAESYNGMNGVTINGGSVESTDGGDWMRYDNVDLGGGYSTFSARYANGGGTGNSAVIRLGSITGTIIGTLSTPSTGGWGTFTTANTSLTGASGIQNIFVVFPSGSGNGNFDWFEFSGNTSVTGVSVSPTTTALVMGVTTTAQLNKTITPANATNQNVSWTTGNSNVATVNSSGLVTAVAAGTATITATTLDGSFTAISTITVNTVTTIDNAIVGSGTNQHNYVGAGWVHNNTSPTFFNSTLSYSNVTNNTVTLSFIGNKIEWYTEKKNTHGIAAVSIDNGTEVNIDLYAATAGQQLLVYTSPAELTQGSHTFKITVTGTKNASSTDFYVVHDFVKIYSSAGGGGGGGERITLMEGPAGLQVHPNPIESGNTLFLEVPGTPGELQISDMMGKLKYTLHTTERQLEIPTTGLADGVYLLHYRSSNGVKSIKIIIK